MAPVQTTGVVRLSLRNPCSAISQGMADLPESAIFQDLRPLILAYAGAEGWYTTQNSGRPPRKGQSEPFV